MPSKKPAAHIPSKRSIKILFCILLIMQALAGCGLLNTPVLPTATSVAASRIPATATSTPTLTPTPTSLPTKKTFPCGRSSAMFILLVGSDARQDTYNIGLSDSMRVIRVDFVEPRVQIMTFPRDLYVEIPEIEDHYGITHGKLNQAYLYGNPGYGYYDGPGRGPGLLSLTLEHNFGSRVDRYFAVNIQTFV
jgi:anionic cell wall polymer biosynthesis LytR-Cps2A-Psr (LCP) family protein